jgi:hypothetical protein
MADGAYDTRKCHDAIADRGAHAVIPPRRNAKPRLSTNPVVCRSAMPNKTFIERHVWIAASL